MGAIGQFTDHQIYAVSKDLAVFNGQIRPITELQGPGFLGWMPPPEIPDAPLKPPTVAPAAQAPPAAIPAPAAAPAPSASTSLLTPTNR